MKMLFTSMNFSEVGLLKDLIEQEAIPCTILNENLWLARGEIPFTQCSPELWILNDEDYPRAKEVLDGWLNPQTEAREPWVCPSCGEKIEGQFASCWKCAGAKGDEQK